MRITAGAHKLVTAGVFLLLVAGLWLGLSLLPERAPEERRQLADLFDRAEAGEGRGRLAEAEAAYRDALALADRLNAAKAQIAARIGLARLAAAHERYDAALTLLSPALGLAQNLKDPDRTATVLNNLGEIARARGNLDEAARRFQQALETPGASDKTRAAALNNLGEIARAERRFDRALDYYRGSLALNEKLDYKPGLAANLANIGAVHLARGRGAEAVGWLERGHRAAFEAGDRLALPAILTTLGQAYAAAGRADDALGSLVEARDQYLLLGLEAKATALTREIRTLREGATATAPAAAPPPHAHPPPARPSSR